jgi:hypothetical protein
MIDNSRTNNNNNNNINIDNSKNLYLVGYNKEDISKIDKKILIKALGGYKTPSEMTKLIHFNENHPEYHNVYIPKINERYGMIYKDGIWKLMDKDELAEDIFENKKSYIIENLNNLVKDLTNMQKKKLTKFLDTPDNDEAIKNTKEQIKMVLYENRKMTMDRKKELDKHKNKPVDIYLQFLDDNTKVNDSHIKTKDLYKSFSIWHKNKINSKIPSNKEFMLNIKKHKIVEQVKIFGKSCYGIKHLKLAE